MKKAPAKNLPYGNIKFKTVDEYMLSLPETERERLEELRMIITQAAPGAEELISYNIPAFKLNGLLVFYAAYKKHIGFYPTASPIKFFEKELTGFKVSKGAIQFPIDKSIPKALVKKIVKFRVEQNLNKQKAKEKK